MFLFFKVKELENELLAEHQALKARESTISQAVAARGEAEATILKLEAKMKAMYEAHIYRNNILTI